MKLKESFDLDKKGKTQNGGRCLMSCKGFLWNLETDGKTKTEITRSGDGEV